MGTWISKLKVGDKVAVQMYPTRAALYWTGGVVSWIGKTTIRVDTALCGVVAIKNAMSVQKDVTGL